MNRLAIPLLCLVAGASAGVFGGYQWRARVAAGEVAATSSAVKKADAPETKLAVAQTVTTKSQPESAAVSADASIESKLNDVLANYDASKVEALIARGDLTMEQIRAGLAHVSAKPKGTKHRLELKAALYRAWAKHSGSEAWRAALADADGANGGTLLGGVAREIATKQPVVALAMAQTLGMGSRRSEVMTEVFAEWGKRDVAAAVVYWNGHPDLPGGSDVIEAALKTAGEEHPDFAAAQALTLKRAGDRGPVLAQVLIDWAGKDHAAALKWAQGISDPELMRTQVAIVVDVLAREDPHAALALADKLQDPEARDKALSNALHRMLEQNPSDAMQVLTSMPSETMVKEIQGWFAYETRTLSFEEQRGLLSQIKDEQARGHIISNLVRRQAENGSYANAVDLINEMPQTYERTGAISNVAESWAKTDAQAAAAWVEAIGDSADRESAVRGLSRALASVDPKGALEWADTIPTVELREGAMMNIAVQWLRKDPGSAEAWLAAQNWLTEAEKAELRKNAAARFGSVVYGGHSRGGR